jgi:hypothetical protein
LKKRTKKLLSIKVSTELANLNDTPAALAKVFYFFFSKKKSYFLTRKISAPAASASLNISGFSTETRHACTASIAKHNATNSSASVSSRSVCGRVGQPRMASHRRSRRTFPRSPAAASAVQGVAPTDAGRAALRFECRAG